MELIETLWNVNKVEMQNTRRAFLELIETLWNVNFSEMSSLSEEFAN